MTKAQLYQLASLAYKDGYGEAPTMDDLEPATHALIAELIAPATQAPSKDQLRFSWSWDAIALNWRISMVDMGDELLAGYDHLAGYYERRLIEEIERLRHALTISRGQWIHSVNASTCLEALGETYASVDGTFADTKGCYSAPEPEVVPFAWTKVIDSAYDMHPRDTFVAGPHRPKDGDGWTPLFKQPTPPPGAIQPGTLAVVESPQSSLHGATVRVVGLYQPTRWSVRAFESADGNTYTSCTCLESELRPVLTKEVR